MVKSEKVEIFIMNLEISVKDKEKRFKNRQTKTNLRVLFLQNEI